MKRACKHTDTVWFDGPGSHHEYCPDCGAVRDWYGTSTVAMMGGPKRDWRGGWLKSKSRKPRGIK